MCQHRGNKLAGTGGTHGNVSAFTCCFHGWRYDLDGKLAYIPDEQSFFDLDKSKLTLMPLASDSWEGFIFVNASLSVGETLDQWIGEMAPLVKGFDFSFPLAGHYRTDLRCNWKIVLDSVQEAYHVVALHRRTVASAFAAKENPFAHLTSARMFKRHRSVSVWGNPKVKPRPSESLALKLARLSSPYTPSINQTNHPGLNPEQDNNWAFDIHVLFPNLQIILGEGYYLTQWAWPVAVDQTRYEVKMYMKPPAVPSESIMQEFNKVMLYDVLLEDLFTLENTQASLSSGLKTELNFSDQEIACRHSYEVIDAMIRS
jgi:phenylpropionate dioxygenase-like ring-hydroxylating dioxygenase large terminal subunit